MATLARAELMNTREQLRMARTGEMQETITLAAVESLVTESVEKRVMPMEMRISQLEQQLSTLAAEKKSSDDKVEFLTSRLKFAEATISRLESQASEADARSFSAFTRGSPDLVRFDDTANWETTSNVSERRAVSALFGGLRHYVRTLMRRGSTEPAQPYWAESSLYV
eukprot:gnl/TRDRNA2_/TRDRNA2_43964_c0_seq1.p1 gnl/TRDRNA2_/TRDRNA2_43964_c0~~gnl/TRDRNA2_/TRDRNA2_43964_c0_seq1.p1  ORF type:complete len:168 (+),score=27.97 gnl/TRDRNA2_/TRDRNA2_43964_c0_seq1:129-632(+)